jgi:hypothetical protein
MTLMRMKAWMTGKGVDDEDEELCGDEDHDE